MKPQHYYNCQLLLNFDTKLSDKFCWEKTTLRIVFTIMPPSSWSWFSQALLRTLNLLLCFLLSFRLLLSLLLSLRLLLHLLLFSATGTGNFTDRNACPRGEVRTLSFFLRICHSFRKLLFARLWMITRSGWHPVTFAYSLEKWSSKVVFQALKSLRENFSLDHLLCTQTPWPIADKQLT